MPGARNFGGLGRVVPASGYRTSGVVVGGWGSDWFLRPGHMPVARRVASPREVVAASGCRPRSGIMVADPDDR
jgi:hypothetical protein